MLLRGLLWGCIEIQKMADSLRYLISCIFTSPQRIRDLLRCSAASGSMSAHAPRGSRRSRRSPRRSPVRTGGQAFAFKSSIIECNIKAFFSQYFSGRFAAAPVDPRRSPSAAGESGRPNGWRASPKQGGLMGCVCGRG